MYRLKTYGPLVLLWICLTSTAPFIFYSWPGHPYKILTMACLSVMMFQLLLYNKHEIFDYKIFMIIVTQIIYYLLIAFHQKDPSNINLCIQLFSLFIIASYIKGFIGFPAFVKSYVYAILGMGIGGTIIFLLHAFIGVTPLFSVDYSASGTSYFMWLTTTNVYFDTSGIRLIRYSGFFDEPGNFALYAIFAILLNKIYLKNKKVEIGLIIVTLFTMSIAFYVVMIFYFLLFNINKSNLKYLFIFPIVVGAFYVYAVNNSSDETVSKIYEFTFKRFEVDDSKGFEGNNRADLSAYDKQTFYNYPFLGAGKANVNIYGSNVFAVLAQYGIIGAAFYYAFLLYFLFKILMINSRKRRVFYFKILLLILINFYHRPEMSSVFTLIVFIAIIYYLRNEYKIEGLNIHNYDNKLECNLKD